MSDTSFVERITGPSDDVKVTKRCFIPGASPTSRMSLDRPPEGPLLTGVPSERTRQRERSYLPRPSVLNRVRVPVHFLRLILVPRNFGDEVTHI